METKNELKPCPCCGGKAEMDIEYIGHDAFPMIQCQFCGLKLVWYSKEEGVLIEKWNARVYPEEVQAAIERAKTVKPKVVLDSTKGWLTCGSCGATVVGGHNYCCHCGQRLDWSEE